MSYKKLSTLVTNLLRSSNLGTVSWEETAKKNAYQAAFGTNVLQISSSGEIDYKIAIFDENGVEIESFEDTDIAEYFDEDGPAYKVMGELYDVARRRALGSEQAIDEILAILKDDEIPF